MQTDIYADTYHPVYKIRIRKIDQDFASELAFKDIKFPAKSRNIHKVEKKIASVLVFLVMKIRKIFQYTFQKMLLIDVLIYYYKKKANLTMFL